MRLRPTRQQYCGKVFYVHRAQQIGFVLDVDPQELHLRMFGLHQSAHLVKALSIVAANTAPLGAQARDQHGVTDAVRTHPG